MPSLFCLLPVFSFFLMLLTLETQDCSYSHWNLFKAVLKLRLVLLVVGLYKQESEHLDSVLLCH